jgi:SWI/SNF-related matrix-associated actin-dependent regulator 1 of chromatin subfamily A
MKLIKLADGKYKAETTFEERSLPKQAGFRWNPEGKYWWTDKRENAARLANYADADVAAELAGLHQQQKEALAESRAADADIEIPIAEGESYLPYQRGGIGYAIKRIQAGQRGVLIGDDMGLGKTIEAIGVINALPQINTVLLVCPANLKINWKREFKRFLVRPFDIQIANGKPINLAMAGRGQIIIVNYDILKKHRAALQAMKFDLMIMDEAHYIKNRNAKKDPKTKQYAYTTLRVREIFEIAPAATHIAALTGTPALNGRPEELWTLLQLLDPKRWTSFFGFGKRYCAGHQTRFGWDFSGISNWEELQRILRETIMVRRLKNDVLKELPPKRRQVIELPNDEFSEQLAAEQEAEARFAAAIDDLEAQRDFAEANDNEEAYRDAVNKLRQVRAAEFTEISKRRHDTALAKVPAVVDHVKGLLDQTEKVIVFAHHHDVFDALQEGLKEFMPVRITGEETTTARQWAVDCFQKDKQYRVAIVSIVVAVGITLTAASTEVFAELDWVPGNMCQAEDRAHRIGQTESVLIQHLVLEDSMDCRMAKTLVAKQADIEKMLDKEPTAFAPLDLPRKRSVRLGDIPELTDDQIAATHAALQFLSARCDHARAIDGQGFNKMDARFGHELANGFKLSKKQAAFGFRMVKKYRRQLPADLRGRLGIAEKEEAFA